MRFLAIRGEHLASLHDAFEVRFDEPPLAGVGLFAIVGPTGAGKSTLLDAACLALYGETPRTCGSGGVPFGAESDEERLRSKDSRSLLTRGCRDGFAEVDFRAPDGHAYRARWQVRRPARTRKLAKDEMSLVRLDDGAVMADKLDATRSAVAKLVGLTFEEFRKAVLLPQGEFAEFLKLDGGKRAELLEKVAGGRLYSVIGEVTAERNRAAQAALQRLLDRVGGLTVLDDAARTALEAERDRLGAELARVEAAVAAAKTALDWHRRRAELQRELDDALVAFQRAEQAVAGAAPRRMELDAIEAALNEASALDTAQRAEEERLRRERHAGELAAALRSAGAKKVTAASALETARAAVRAFDDEVERTRPQLDEAKRLDLLVESAQRLVTDRTSAAEGARRAATEAAGVVARLERELAAHRTARDEAARWLAEHQGEAPITSEWSRWKDVARRHADASRAAAEARRRLSSTPTAAAVQGAWSATREAKVAAEAAARAAAEMEQRLGEATARHRDASVRDEEARLALERARAVQGLESRRAELVDGEPCPLCGATEHPWARDFRVDAVVGEAAARAGETQAALKTCAGSLEQAVNAHRQAQGDARTAEKAAALKADAARQLEEALASAGREATEAELRRAEGERDACEAALATPFAAVRGWKEALRGDAAAFVQAYDATAAAHAERRDRLERASGELAARDPALAAAQSTAAERQRASDDAGVQVKKAVAEAAARSAERGQLFGGRGTADVEKAFADRRQRLDLAFEECRTADEAAAREEAATQGQHEQAARGAADARTKAAEAATALALALARLGVTREVLAGRVAKGRAGFVDAERRALAAIDQALHERRGQLTARRSALEQHEPERPALDAGAAATRQQEAEEAGRALQRSHLDALARVKADDTARATRAALGAELDEARAKADTWGRLHALIGQGGQSSYRTFVQGLALEVLVENANHHLRELAPRYRLQRVPATDMDLQVVDRDQADSVRAVTSLSGGETFLVSLALALGLSALSTRATRVETLFIDEGFGSLDAETLDQAMGVLESLQATGRTVGIISHVPELHERVGVVVRVEKRGGGRSQVSVEQVGA